MTGEADADSRRRILTDYDSTLFVEAAAGTGKTTALVGRIVRLVRAGAAQLNRVVAVTFTEKAAGEMKLHLRSQIERARSEATPVERGRFDLALSELELARIGTIHAFCGDLLRERPVEAGIDPLFEVASEPATEALAAQAFDAWFERALSRPPEGIRRLLRRRSRGSSPREELRLAMNRLREHRDFPQGWRRDPFDRNGAIDALIPRLTAVGRLAIESSWPEDYLSQNLAEIAKFIDETTRLEAVQGRDYDGLEAELRRFARHWSWRWSGARRTRFGALTRDEVLVRRDTIKAELDDFAVKSGADLAPLLHEDLQEPIAQYELLKTKAGQLDYLDLLIKTRDLIRDHAAVREELQQRFTHFFVDEFQDTDPLQAEILLLLAASDPNVTDWRPGLPIAGKLFIVGDPKQSIYRFRRAEIAVYEEVKQQLLAHGASLLHLTKSFRAPPSIQSFVNGAFAAAMAAGPDAAQAHYVPLGHARPEVLGQPTLIALPVPAPYNERGTITNARIEEFFPPAVGAFVDWLVSQSGWKVEEKGEAVPVRPRHIAILFRRFRNYDEDITRPYIRALEGRRIPHVIVGGRSFYDCEEIIALRNALTAIEWPDDELSVFATFRGPLFALGDEALLTYRQIPTVDGFNLRRLNPMRAPERSDLAPAAIEVADALELLRTLHLGRNRRPIAQTIMMFLEAVRAHAGIALWSTGEQALANCQRLVDMARQFERGASSFRAFLNSLEKDAAHGDANEAPIVEEGTEGVRVMTVHRAKGLEFPVVILANPTCPASRDTPSRHVDAARHLWLEPLCGCMPAELVEASAAELRAEEAEAVRTAYVAATRARDLLIAPVCGDRPIEGWLSSLNPLLYPTDDRSTSISAPGCPPFGTDSVLDRGSKGAVPQGGPVSPGLHRPKSDGPPIVWWDPSRLVLEVEEHGPLRHQAILEPTKGDSVVASEQDYLNWREERENLIARSAAPTLLVQTVTSRARARVGTTAEDRGSAPAFDVQVVMIERAELNRPGGRRFGALVHAILASIDLDAGAEAIQASADTNGRILSSTVDEVAAAVVAVGTALQHPILRRAKASAATGGIRREVPVAYTSEDGTLIEGVIDLAFYEALPASQGWTVVDFKTDQEFNASSEQYLCQVGLYSQAVGIATNSSVRGVIFVI